LADRALECGRARAAVLVGEARGSAAYRGHAWVEYLEGKNPGFPETILKRDLDSIPRRLAEMQKDPTTPETRVADNAMEFNPAAVGGMAQLMWGALVPGREGVY
jgi:hypothetical protein